MNPAIFTPEWNLRKAIKELLLLEEHLADPEQRCPDCIWKHLLKFEAWIEEAATLDNNRKYSSLLTDMVKNNHQIQAAVRSRHLKIASEVARATRKSLQQRIPL